jgi:hypothetical protein
MRWPVPHERASSYAAALMAALIERGIDRGRHARAFTLLEFARLRAASCSMIVRITDLTRAKRQG